MAELLEPGGIEPEFCAPGSIEQQLDMCEEGTLRGDEILHHHGDENAPEANSETPVNLLMDRYEMDMAEEGREGDELSGDEHSSGLQGSELTHAHEPLKEESIEGAPLVLIPRPERRAKRKHRRRRTA